VKIAFIHSFKITKKNDKYYSLGFPYKIWERYLTVFEEVVVVSRLNKDQNNKKLVQSSGDNVTFKPVKSYTSTFSYFTNYKSIKKELEEVLDDVDGAIIRVPSVLGAIAAKICREKNKKYSVEVVGSGFNALWYYGILGKPFAFIAEYLQRKTVKKSAVAVYVTEDYLQSAYPTQGIPFGKVSNVTVEKNNKEKSYEINRNIPIRIGLVGSSFVKYKGHYTALKTLEVLLKKEYNLVLSLVGQGPSKYLNDNIKKLNLKDNVEVLGVLHTREQMNEWYKSLDFYVQPSFTEGLCRSIIEAIDNGVPTYASNVGGNPESVSQEYLFNKKDYKHLAQLISEAIDNPNIAINNIEKNKKKIEKFKTIDVEKRRKKAFETYKKIVKENLK